MPKHLDGKIDHYIVEEFFQRISSLNEPVRVVYEKVWGQVGSGTKQVYQFGRNNGNLEALVWVYFGRDIKEVVPRTWQKWLFDTYKIEEQKNTKGKRDTKKMALDAISYLYPSQDLRATKRSKVAHSGIVDAVGIAVYGQEKEL